MTNPEFDLTREQAAVFVGCSAQTIYNRVIDGKLREHRHRGQTRYRKSDLVVMMRDYPVRNYRTSSW